MPIEMATASPKKGPKAEAFVIKVANFFKTEPKENYRIAKIEDRYKNTITFSYNTLGHLIKITDPSGRIIRIEASPKGLIRRIIDPEGNRIEYSYNFKHLLSAITDQNNNITSFSYDSSDRITDIIYPTKRKITISYDENYRVKKIDDEGRITLYLYEDTGTPDRKGLKTIVKDPRQNTYVHNYLFGYFTYQDKVLEITEPRRKCKKDL